MTLYFILLGKETAIKLASLGADIIILCRNPEKAEEAVADIKRESGFTSVRYSFLVDRYSFSRSVLMAYYIIELVYLF